MATTSCTAASSRASTRQRNRAWCDSPSRAWSTNVVAPLASTAGNYSEHPDLPHQRAVARTGPGAHLLEQHARPRQSASHIQGLPQLHDRERHARLRRRVRQRSSGNRERWDAMTPARLRVPAWSTGSSRSTTSGTEEGTADVSVTIAGQTYTTTYADAVRADDPDHYYRFNEAAGSTLARDLVGNDDLITFAGVTRGSAGALGTSPISGRRSVARRPETRPVRTPGALRPPIRPKSGSRRAPPEAVRSWPSATP